VLKEFKVYQEQTELLEQPAQLVLKEFKVYQEQTVLLEQPAPLDRQELLDLRVRLD
jgi:hypothetical protein